MCNEWKVGPDIPHPSPLITSPTSCPQDNLSLILCLRALSAAHSVAHRTVGATGRGILPRGDGPSTLEVVSGDPALYWPVCVGPTSPTKVLGVKAYAPMSIPTLCLPLTGYQASLCQLCGESPGQLGSVLASSQPGPPVARALSSVPLQQCDDSSVCMSFPAFWYKLHACPAPLIRWPSSVAASCCRS